MVILMSYLHGASDKATFVLYSYNIGFTLLQHLVIDLRLVIKIQNKYSQKSHTIFDSALFINIGS